MKKTKKPKQSRNTGRSAARPCASETVPPDRAVTPDLLAQLSATLWLPHDMDEAEKTARIGAARAMLEDMDPAPGMESMLACQMVAVHAASVECMRRAMVPDQSPELRDHNLKHAERLLSLYTRQTDALGRHRAREEKRRAQRDQAPHRAKAQEQPDAKPREVYRGQLPLVAEEWWAARAHVVDPRVVLARGFAREEAREAGLNEDEVEAVARRVAAETEADPPTVDGKPYILDFNGVRVYPLPDGRLVKAAGVTDKPFRGYFDLLRDRDGEAAANQAAEAAARRPNGHDGPPGACPTSG